MPDITLCAAINCVMANECWRKLAKPDAHQWFFNPLQEDDKGENCEYYIPKKWEPKKCKLPSENNS